MSTNLDLKNQIGGDNKEFEHNKTQSSFKNNNLNKSNLSYKSGSKPYISNIGLSKVRESSKKKCCEECSKGRNEKVDCDKYLKVCSENEKLKLEQLRLNDQYKNLQTQLYSVGEKISKERYMGNKKVIYMDQGSELEMLNLKNENEKLRDQLMKTKTVIKGMQTKEKMRGSSSQKILINTKSTSDTTTNHNEYLKLIKELKNSLNDKDNEIKRLHTELFSRGKGTNVNFMEYSKELRDKTEELGEIRIKYESIQNNMEMNSRVIKNIESALKEKLEQLKEEQRKNLELRTENMNLKVNVDRIPEYLTQIDNYRKRELDFELRIQGLCESPYIKIAEEKGNIVRKLQEAEAALSKQAFELEKLKSTNLDFSRDLERFKIENGNLKREKDEIKEELIRFRVAQEERSKNSHSFEEQLRLLSQYGEVDSNFQKILSLLKLKDNDNSWMKIEFFDRIKESDIKDPEFLLKEIEKLIQEKGELGNQLEVTKNILVLQQKINEDLKKEYQEHEKITNYQISELKKKCDILAKRNDIDRKGKGKQMNNLKKDLMFGLKNEKDADFADNISVQDSITEFTKDDTDNALGINENILDLYLGEAVLEDGISTELGIKLNDLLTFASVDFFMHDIQTSNLASGKRPWYNLQIKYHVIEDEHFIKYIDSGSNMTIEINYLKNNVSYLLGYGHINLKQLLEVENDIETNNNSRVINSVCPIFFKNDSSLLIGNVHYKMRMRNSIKDTLKWLYEKMKLVNNNDNLDHVINLNSDDKINNLRTIPDLNKGRVMQVTIMISQLINLKISGPPHEIRPYIWYQFQNQEHFSKTASGHSPMLEDIFTTNCIYNTEFNDYIQNGELSIMVLDDFRSLEVKVNQTGDKNIVDLVDNPEIEDFIGICNINLKSLILSDKIQGNFPIINRDGNKSGEIFLLIFWEQINVIDNKLSISPYEKKSYEEDLIISLGTLLRNKKLTLESAFEFFNLDNQENITISNFKLVMMTQLKYSDPKKIDTITDLIFQENLFLSKLEFNKIFMPLLPKMDNNVNSTLNDQSKNNQMIFEGKEVRKNTEITITHQNQKDAYPNIIEENTSLNIVSNNDTNKKEINSSPIKLNNERGIKEKDDNYEFSYKPKTKIEPNNLDNQKKITVKDYNRMDTNRNLNEIVLLVSNFMKTTKKSTISELFKIFDQRCQDSFISKEEVLNGFFNISVPISYIELEKIWTDMTEENTKKAVDLSLFKKFFERNGFVRI